MNELQKTLRGRDWILILFIAFFARSIFVFILSSLHIQERESIASIFMYLVLFIAIAGILRTDNVRIRRFIGTLPEDMNWNMLIALVGLNIALSLSTVIITFYFIPLPAVEIAAQSPSLTFLYLVILAPLVEEVLFRGLLLHLWSEMCGLKTGIVATSLVFALFHPQNILGTFIFAIILSLFYIETKTLLVPIAAHMLNNMFPWLLSSLVYVRETENAVQANISINELLFAIAIAVFSLFLLLYYIHKHWPRKRITLSYHQNRRGRSGVWDKNRPSSCIGSSIQKTELPYSV